MKLTQLPIVTDLVAQQQRLQDMVDAAQLSLIDLRIGGKAADLNVISVCHPAILRECRAQIANIESRLRTLGVEID